MKKKALMVSLVVAVSLTFTVFLAGAWAENRGHKRKNPWAGHWGCSFSTTTASGHDTATVSQMTLSASGDVQGHIKTAMLVKGELPLHLILDCTSAGTWWEIGERYHYIKVETSSICIGMEEEIEVEQELDCAGLLKGKNGYTEMFCIDLTEEKIKEIVHVTTVLCKRSDLK